VWQSSLPGAQDALQIAAAPMEEFVTAAHNALHKPYDAIVDKSDSYLFRELAIF